MLVASKSADLYLPTSVQHSDMVESCSLKFTFPQGPSFFTVLSPSSDGSQQNHESKHRHKKLCGIILFSTTSSTIIFITAMYRHYRHHHHHHHHHHHRRRRHQDRFIFIISSESFRSVWMFVFVVFSYPCVRLGGCVRRCISNVCLCLCFLQPMCFFIFRKGFCLLWLGQLSCLGWFLSGFLFFYTCGSSLLLFSLRSDWLQYAKSRGTIQGRELIGQFKCEEWESVRTTKQPRFRNLYQLVCHEKGRLSICCAGSEVTNWP